MNSQTKNKLAFLAVFILLLTTAIVFSARSHIKNVESRSKEILQKRNFGNARSIDEYRSGSEGRAFVVTLDSAKTDEKLGTWQQAVVSDTEKKLQPSYLPIFCNRIHVNSVMGICIKHTEKDRYLTDVSLFLASGEENHIGVVAGHPSRARISQDSKYAALTTFVSGDSYNSAGFSTRTYIIDIATRKITGTLENYSLKDKQGQLINPVDKNYWGVTFFKDGDHFLATVMYSGKKYLVEGRISDQSLKVIAENVECPSLSPNEDKVVFKYSTSVGWNLRVMNLANLETRDIPDPQNIDDQVEWMDNDFIVYSRHDLEKTHSALIKMPVSGLGTPEILHEELFSPGIIR